MVVVDHAHQGLQMALWLHVGTHHAKTHDRPTGLRQESRDDGVKRPLARRDLIDARVQAKATAASTALPPWTSIRSPAWAASRCEVDTTLRANNGLRVDRQGLLKSKCMRKIMKPSPALRRGLRSGLVGHNFQMDSANKPPYAQRHEGNGQRRSALGGERPARALRPLGEVGDQPNNVVSDGGN